MLVLYNKFIKLLQPDNLMRILTYILLRLQQVSKKPFVYYDDIRYIRVSPDNVVMIPITST